MPVVAPDDDAGEAFRRIVGDGLGRALVFDRGRLDGMPSITDFMRAIELPRIGRATSPSRDRGPWS